MIDIITYCDDHHEILKNFYFKPSFDIYLKNHFNHIDLKYINSYNDIFDTGFGGKSFQDIIYKRWSMIINHIKKFPDPNKISIFSDIDIVFFGNFYDDITILFSKNPDMDIYFMPEIVDVHDKTNINAGFFIFKHTENSVKFFQLILNFMLHQKVKEDQVYIRQELRKNKYNNIGVLDYRIFNTNNCSLNTNKLLIQTNSLKVFHATSCSDIFDKLSILYKLTNELRNSLIEVI